MKKYCLLFFWLLVLGWNNFLYAQNPPIFYLDTVSVTAPVWHKKNTWQIDSTLQNAYQTQHLGEMLQQNAALYVKMYGNGMLATPAWRGTTAAQTQILWNGFTINSVTLGQTDFSLVPVAAAEQIEAETGGSSVAPAIGGNILLRNTLPAQQGTQLQLSQEMASFGTFKTNAKASVSRNKWAFQQSVFRYQGKNNFWFFHPNEQRLMRQTNAAWEQIGALQHLSWKPRPQQSLTLHTWQQQSFRQIQPTFLIRNNFQQRQSDMNWRAVAEYQTQWQHHQITLATAYFYDKMRFEDPPFLQNDYHSQQWQNRILYESPLLPYTQLQAGGEWQGFFTHNSIYQASEWRSAVWAQLRTQLRSFFAQTAWRYQYISGFQVPLLPIFSVGYQMPKGWNVTAKWQKNYRLPTLNERYWQPGGNPTILPETAHLAELQVQHTTELHRWGKVENTATLFYIQTKNLIQWLPQDTYWQPENTQGISTNRGAEWKMQWKYKNKQWSYQLQYNFTYSLAQNEQGYRLMYAPLQQSGFFAQIQYKKVAWWGNYSYTSLRYTDIYNEPRYAIPGFDLVNMGLQIYLQPHQATVWNAQLRFQINNLFNQHYQNFINRAMPLRHYSLSCIFWIKSR